MTSLLGPRDLIDELIRNLNQMKADGWLGFDCTSETLSVINAWAGNSQNKSVPAPLRGPDTLARIRTDLGDCQRCALCQSRKHIVFGSGNPQANLVFIGAQIELEDDQQGEPFAGPAGQLLTRIIAAMKLNRSEVYLCNIVKCRPPNHRNPLKPEIDLCLPFLRRQLDTIGPAVICTLGRLASQTLLMNDLPMAQLRGHFHDYNGIKVMPTFAPEELLRRPEKKRDTWADIQKIMHLLKIPVR